MATDIFSAANKMFSKSVEVASDLFEKSVDASRDLAGTATEAANKGRVKAKLYDLGLEYDKLMRDLGKAVYDDIKDDAKYVDANKELFEKIAACVERRQILEDELSDVEAAADAAKPVDVQATEASAEAEVVEAEVIESEATSK